MCLVMTLPGWSTLHPLPLWPGAAARTAYNLRELCLLFAPLPMTNALQLLTTIYITLPRLCPVLGAEL
jgi:hypothetical protein